MSRGSSTGGGGGHWKESPKKNAMNELQDKLMTVRLREAEAQAELREVKLKALQLESQVSHVHIPTTPTTTQLRCIELVATLALLPSKLCRKVPDVCFFFSYLMCC